MKTELIVKATAALEAEIKKDLEKEEPTLEVAKALINENTTGNDRSGSNKNNNHSCRATGK